MMIKRLFTGIYLGLGLLGSLQAATAEDEQCQQIRQRYASGQPSARAENEMAFCAARGGKVDEAFAYLEKALAKGLKDHRLVAEDEDYLALRKDPRWEPLMKRLAAAEAAYLPTINAELRSLYQADQADRQRQPIDWSVVGPRDDERRARVLALAGQGQLKAAIDYFHAAMVMQHGSTVEDYALALEWSRKACALDAETAMACWLSAAAEDRYLQAQGKPQIWGTQYRRADGQSGPWTQEPFDRQARTDAQRKAMGVPPLAQSEQRLQQMNAPQAQTHAH